MNADRKTQRFGVVAVLAVAVFALAACARTAAPGAGGMMAGAPVASTGAPAYAAALDHMSKAGEELMAAGDAYGTGHIQRGHDLMLAATRDMDLAGQCVEGTACSTSLHKAAAHMRRASALIDAGDIAGAQHEMTHAVEDLNGAQAEVEGELG